MYVYVLYDKRTNWLLYIGKTYNSTSKRLREHLNSCKTSSMLLHLYINEAGKENIDITFIDSYDDSVECDMAEKWWIYELEPPFNVKGQRWNTSLKNINIEPPSFELFPKKVFDTLVYKPNKKQIIWPKYKPISKAFRKNGKND